eukprot:1095523-Amphidinium_carterae.1
MRLRHRQSGRQIQIQSTQKEGEDTPTAQLAEGISLDLENSPLILGPFNIEKVLDSGDPRQYSCLAQATQGSSVRPQQVASSNAHSLHSYSAVTVVQPTLKCQGKLQVMNALGGLPLPASPVMSEH